MSGVLVVARELPYPPNAGDRIVTHGFLRALRELGHDVHVLAYRRPDDEAAARSLQTLCTSVRTVPQTESRLPTPVHKAVRYARGDSHVMAMFDSAAIRETAAARIEAVDPDVVLAQHPYMGQIFRDHRVEAAIEATDARRVTNAHVVEYEAHRRHRQYATDLATRLELALEIPRLRTAEVAVYDCSDRTLVLGERDRRELADVVSTPVETQRVALDSQRYETATPGEERDGRLLFFGSYDWFPNEDAITYFCEEVYPRIRRTTSESELVVAGRGAPETVRALDDRPGVEVVGEVEDLSALVRTASVVVAPIRVGGGVRIKVLESMAWQVPVVTTPSGFEGVDATPGEDLLVADGTPALAEAVRDLLDDPDRRYRLARQGRKTIEQRYSTAAVADELEANLRLDDQS